MFEGDEEPCGSSDGIARFWFTSCYRGSLWDSGPNTDMLLPGRPQAPRHDPVSGSMALFHIVKSSTETRS